VRVETKWTVGSVVRPRYAKNRYIGAMRALRAMRAMRIGHLFGDGTGDGGLGVGFGSGFYAGAWHQHAVPTT
jgi:hypothetical protein